MVSRICLEEISMGALRLTVFERKSMVSVFVNQFEKLFMTRYVIVGNVIMISNDLTPNTKEHFQVIFMANGCRRSKAN